MGLGVRGSYLEVLGTLRNRKREPMLNKRERKNEREGEKEGKGEKEKEIYREGERERGFPLCGFE